MDHSREDIAEVTNLGAGSLMHLHKLLLGLELSFEVRCMRWHPKNTCKHYHVVR